jgi:hypothetical protein
VLQNQPFRVGAEKKQNLHPMNDMCTNQLPFDTDRSNKTYYGRTNNSESDLHSESAALNSIHGKKFVVRVCRPMQDL